MVSYPILTKNIQENKYKFMSISQNVAPCASCEVLLV